MKKISFVICLLFSLAIAKQPKKIIYCNNSTYETAKKIQVIADSKLLEIEIVKKDSFTYREVVDSLLSWKDNKSSIFLLNQLSFSEDINNYELKLSPNPAVKGVGGRLYYNIKNPDDLSKKIQIEVLDNDGKKIYSINKKGKVGRNKLIFSPYSNLPVGVYFVKLIIDGEERDAIEIYIVENK